MNKIRVFIIWGIIVMLVSACQKTVVEKSDEVLVKHQVASKDVKTDEQGANVLDSNTSEIEDNNESSNEQSNRDSIELNNQEEDSNKDENEKETSDDNIEVLVEDETVVPEYTEVLESYSIDYNRNGYYYLSMNVIDGYVYMIRDNQEDNMVQILGLDLNNLENTTLKNIYEESGAKSDYKGPTDCFIKTKDGEIICTMMNRLVWIDPLSHEVVKTEDISLDIKDIQLSHDEQMKSYMKEDLNLYLYRNDIGEVMIEEGYYLEDAGGVGVLIHIPHRPKWSQEDTYLAYDIGLYESSNGPIITDASGNILLDSNFDSTEYWWINDYQMVVSQTFYDGTYMGVLDMNTYEFWYLNEDNNIRSLTFNEDAQMLSIYVQEPYNHLKIYDANQMLKYTEILIPEELYSDDYIWAIEDKVFIIKERKDKLIIDIYPLEGNSKAIEPRIKKYPILDNIKKWYDIETGTVYGSQNIDPMTGSIDLFYKENLNQNINYIGTYFGASDNPKTIPLVNALDDYYALINEERLIDIQSGDDIGLKDYYEGLPDREFHIKASNVYNRRYAYLISYWDDKYTYYELYENEFHDMKYTLIDSFKMDVGDYFFNDFRVSYDHEGNLYYDYYDIDTMKPMIKCKKSNGELVEVIENALQGTLLSGGDLVQYTHITGFSKDERYNSYQVLYNLTTGQELDQFIGRMFESNDFLIKIIFGEHGTCEIIDKVNYEVINTVELANLYIVHVEQQEDEIQLYVMDVVECNYDIKMISIPIVTENQIAKHIEEENVEK